MPYRQKIVDFFCKLLTKAPNPGNMLFIQAAMLLKTENPIRDRVFLK